MIVAVAAKDASYRRRVCITEAGDVGKPELATLLHEGRKTIQYYRFYYRPGVGIEDIVYRKPRLLSKTEYLLNGQRQLAGLFGYIETSEPVAEQYFKELKITLPQF